MPESSDTPKFKSWEFPLTALLAWLVPGAGHFYLGQRKRAILLFIVIELTFFFGLYIGTLRIVDPAQSTLWFIPQMLVGLSTIVARLISTSLPKEVFIYDWSYNMAVLYTGLAGLLNLLAIFDAVIRVGRANLDQQPASAN